MTPTLSGLSHFAVLLDMLVFQVKVKKMVFSINHSSFGLVENENEESNEIIFTWTSF